MKTKIILSALSAILIGSITVKHFWPSNNAEIIPRDHIDEKGHAENTIFLSSEQIKDLDIQTRIAGPGPLSVTISTRGKIILHPDRLAHVLPKISGVAKEIRKNIGNHVKEGEILAILESREMADIKASYLAAKEKERLALSLLDREKRLHEKKNSAEQDYLNP